MQEDGRLERLHETARRRRHLSDQQVVEIWDRCQQPFRYGLYAEIARDYGVGVGVVYAIKDRIRYTDITRNLQDAQVP